MKTICYLRVSSPKRNGHSRQTTESQKLALKSYCQLHKLKPTYLEDFATGRNQDRKSFQEVMDACRSGRCEQLIVWKLDRLGRSTVETIQTIQELLELGVKVVVTTQGLTFDKSPYSTFLINLFAALSQLESDHASERIKAGLSVAKAKGVKLGRKPDERKRLKIAKWSKLKIPVAVQAERLKISRAAVYALRERMTA
jgi:DNA invertase Pin-like site-specific DNA recombinase